MKHGIYIRDKGGESIIQRNDHKTLVWSPFEYQHNEVVDGF